MFEKLTWSWYLSFRIKWAELYIHCSSRKLGIKNKDKYKKKKCFSCIRNKNAVIATDQKWEHASTKNRFIKYGSWINNRGWMRGGVKFNHSQQTLNWFGLKLMYLHRLMYYLKYIQESQRLPVNTNLFLTFHHIPSIIEVCVVIELLIECNTF